jgi:hypothetical protein
VTGPCDTIWAGHAFQRNVSHNTAAGMRNQIIIEPGGSIAGGQGLLIWSLNYDVENRGTIIGATEKKFGMSDTENIAILFKGDSSTRYGVPIIAGSNSLINFGTIMSPVLRSGPRPEIRISTIAPGLVSLPAEPMPFRPVPAMIR